MQLTTSKAPKEGSKCHSVSTPRAAQGFPPTKRRTHNPAVIHYPRFPQNTQGGALIKSFSTVMDICPTILDLAGIQHPAPGTENGTYRGRQVAPMRGRSWVSPIQASTRFQITPTTHSIRRSHTCKTTKP